MLSPKIPHWFRDLLDWASIADGGLLKRNGATVSATAIQSFIDTFLAAADKPAARAALDLTIGTHVVAPTGSGAGLTTLSAAAVSGYKISMGDGYIQAFAFNSFDRVFSLADAGLKIPASATVAFSSGVGVDDVTDTYLGRIAAGVAGVNGVAVPTVNTMKPVSYTVAVAAALTPFPAAGTAVYVTNEAGGATWATSNGTVFKRQTDLATIS